MKGTSPDIIYIQKYHQYFTDSFKSTKEYQRMPDVYNDLIKMSQFYRDPGSQNSLTSYLTRSGACDKSPILTDEQRAEQAYLVRERVEEPNIVNYMDHRKGSCGLFDEHGDVSKAGLKEIRKNLSQCKTNIYEGVLSFTQEYSDKVVKDKKEAYELLKEIMPKYFKDKGLDPNNMTWFAAYHLNTKHHHCHIIFYEKTPSAYKQNGAPKNIDFTRADLNHFKELVAFARPMEHEYQFLRQPVIDSLKEESKYSPYKEFIQEVRDVVGRKKQFARCTKEERQIILEYKNFIYNNSEIFKTNYDKMIEGLAKKQEEILSNYKAMNMKPNEYAINFAKNRTIELNERICNTIMKTAFESPLLNPKVSNKPINFMSQSRKHTAKIRFSTVMNHTFDKAYKNNPTRLAQVLGLSRTGQVNLFAAIDSYQKVINSQRIWQELEEQRRLQEMQAKQELGGEGR